MKLDPKARALLTAIAVAGEPAIDTVPLEYAREQVEKGYGRMNIPVKQVGAITNRTVQGSGGEIPIRIYTPFGKGPFPVVVYFHGGGWVFFHLDAYDPTCTHLCLSSESIIVSVDYRLSPEFKFPAAIDDCFESAKWANLHCMEWNGIPGSLVLAGDSAGGNLATVVSMKFLAEGSSLVKGQVLIYPVTDHYLPEKPSYIEFADGYGLTKDAMKWFWGKYLAKEEDALNPLAAPLKSSNLQGLPPAYILVAGYDPLRDDGLQYAEKLKEFGVNVTLSVYEDMIHGFLSYLGILRQATTAIDEIGGWIGAQSNTRTIEQRSLN